MNVFVPQVLDQGHARALVLDKERVVVTNRAPAAMKLNELALEMWILGLSDLEHVIALINTSNDERER
jgi:hypothetical protein